jgi:hypothetical protein
VLIGPGVAQHPWVSGQLLLRQPRAGIGTQPEHATWC